MATGSGTRYHGFRIVGRQWRTWLRFLIRLEGDPWPRRQRPVLHSLQRVRRGHGIQRRCQVIPVLVAFERVGHAVVSSELYTGGGLEREWLGRTLGKRWRRKHALCQAFLANWSRCSRRWQARRS